MAAAAGDHRRVVQQREVDPAPTASTTSAPMTLAATMAA
jgi:hypothetical protein